MDEKLVVFTLRLPESTRKQLKVRCALDGRGMNETINLLIVEYLRTPQS